MEVPLVDKTFHFSHILKAASHSMNRFRSVGRYIVNKIFSVNKVRKIFLTMYDLLKKVLFLEIYIIFSTLHFIWFFMSRLLQYLFT